MLRLTEFPRRFPSMRCVRNALLRASTSASAASFSSLPAAALRRRQQQEGQWLPTTTMTMNAGVRGLHVQPAPSLQEVVQPFFHSDDAATSAAPVATKEPLDELAASFDNNDAMLCGPRPEQWWTGKQPQECLGYQKEQGFLASAPLLRLDNADGRLRERMLDYFDNSWTLSEQLYGALQGTEAFVSPPVHDLRHPLIFYYGHTAAFYVNKLRVAGFVEQPVNSYFESLFEVGVDEMSWDDLSKNTMAWPSVAEVNAYRRRVYQIVRNVVLHTPQEFFDRPVDEENPLWAVPMACEHERIHLETSSVLMREMDTALLRRPDDWAPYHPSVHETPCSSFPEPEMIAVDAGTVNLGKPRDFPSYGWDNEYGNRQYDVKAFKASKHMVSNGEFLEFVRSGGYMDEAFWTQAGWGWRSFRNAKWPTFWVPDGPGGLHHYKLRLTFDEVPMQALWPAVVNYHEAMAFCNWKSQNDASGRTFRLITELEHVKIRDDRPDPNTHAPEEVDPVMGVGTQELLPEAYGINANLAFGSESPVDALPANSKGFCDVQGSVWEWCEDHFSALPGFRIHPYYEDFSTPCFDGEHNVIQGGSFISTGDEASVFARFHFRPHFFQHAGFRIAEGDVDNVDTSCTDAPGPFVGEYPFRSKLRDSAETAASALVSRELARTFPDAFLPSSLRTHATPLHSAMSEAFSTAVANTVVDACGGAAALADAEIVEVGCGVGGIAVQLASAIGDMTGGSILAMDLNGRLIETARALQDGKQISVSVLRGDGELADDATVQLPSAWREAAAASVEFKQADPMCLPAELQAVDVVILTNVLEQVPSPNGVLARCGGVRGLVKHGGVVIVTSTLGWTEDRTPKNAWLGGLHDTQSGQVVESVEGIKAALGPDFTVTHNGVVPSVGPSSVPGQLILDSNHIFVCRRDGGTGPQ